MSKLTLKKKMLHRSLAAMALGAVTLSGPSIAFADVFRIADIRLQGLQRISPGTVFSYMPVKVGDTVGDDVTAGVIRSLYQTGLFDDVRVDRDRNVLVVSVRERPAIERVTITGNKVIKTPVLTKVLDSIGIRSGMAYDKVRLDQISKEIDGQYVQKGYYGVVVDTTAAPLPGNRVAININVSEGATARIKQINIIGAHAFPVDTLRDLFKLKTKRWNSFFTHADRYESDKLSADLERLQSFYMDRGYIDFEIKSSQVSISPDRKEIYISVVIDEGKPYTLTDIHLSGSLPVPESEIFSLIRLKRGQVFSRKDVTDSVQRIRDRLADSGFASANVNLIPDVNRDKQEVSATFYVDPGKRVYVRRINMYGNYKSRDEVLRRAMTQLESSPISRKALEESKERMMRLGFFEDVQIETPPVPDSPDQVDVDVTVKERPAGNITGSVGYSQSDGVMFGAAINQSNFLGTGKNVGIAFNTSKVSTLYSFSYTNPFYTPEGISRGVDIAYQKTDYSEYTNSSYSTDTGTIGLNYSVPISLNSSFGFGGRYNYTKIHPDQSILSQYYVRKNGKSQNDFQISIDYNRDTRNTAIFPSTGSTFYARLASTVPGSDQQYYNIEMSARKYFELTKDLTLTMLGEASYGFGYGKTKNLPFYENYYVGGPDSIRGWESNSLGPREIGNDDYTAGGNFKLNGSIELLVRPPLGEQYSNNVRVGAFIDFGNVWLTKKMYGVDRHGVHLGDMRYSAGISFKWYSPIGALGLSYARPIHGKKPEDDLEAFQFSVGRAF